MKNGWFWIFSLIFIFSNFNNSANLHNVHQKSSMEKVAVKKEISSLGEVEIEYGINGYMRISSTVRVKVEIKNAKKDFDGSIHLRYYSVGDTISSYSEDITIKKDEDTTVYFYPFLNTTDPDFTIVFYDKNGKEIEKFADDIETGTVDETSELVIASFLPKDVKLSFVGEKDFRVKYICLSEDKIKGDYRDLSLFDLVIKPNDFESTFNSKTLEILKERERRGGLSILEKEAEEFKLGRLYLGKEDRIEWTWKAERVLVPVLENLKIKTGKYVAIIFIYIIVVSPVTYFILAKRKRKVQYWIFVPVWSIIFTVIIYMVSTDSRIEGMYINYVSVLDLRKDRQSENVVFSVTNSSNMPYKLEINNGYNVESLYGSYSKIMDKDQKKVIYNIENKANGADINVMEATAFDTLFLKAGGVPEIALENAGEIYRDEGVVKGIFKNTTGVNLKRVFAVYDDEIIYIGDVSKGGSKSFKGDEGNLFLNDLNARLQDSAFLNKIFNFAYEGEDSKVQTLITEVLEKNSVLCGKKPFFVALSAGKLRGEFVSGADTARGYTILMVSAEKKEDIGIETDSFINSIGKLPMSVGDLSYSFSNGALVNKNSIDISYTPNKNKVVKCLSLLSRYKEEINPCRVSILNHITGEYDLMFSPDEDFIRKFKEYTNSGGKAEFDRGKDQTFDISSVYSENGKFTLRYEVEQSVYDEISAFAILNIPKISLEYEE